MMICLTVLQQITRNSYAYGLRVWYVEETLLHAYVVYDVVYDVVCTSRVDVYKAN